MYGYQVLLQSPNRATHTVLRIVSRRRYASVITLLRGEKLMDQYADWTMLRFKTAFAPNTRTAPQVIDHQTAEPGSAIAVIA